MNKTNFDTIRFFSFVLYCGALKFIWEKFPCFYVTKILHFLSTVSCISLTFRPLNLLESIKWFNIGINLVFFHMANQSSCYQVSPPYGHSESQKESIAGQWPYEELAQIMASIVLRSGALLYSHTTPCIVYSFPLIFGVTFISCWV